MLCERDGADFSKAQMSHLITSNFPDFAIVLYGRGRQTRAKNRIYPRREEFVVVGRTLSFESNESYTQHL